jgi:adenylate kinase
MILFFGPAGAGKSVQGQLLAARHGWRWISAGQLLRDTHNVEILQQMSRGILVSDQQIQHILSDALKRSQDIDHLILDGFPRQLMQAQWLVETQPQHNRSISLCLVLEVPREELLKRLHVRGRVDDTPESIEQRLIDYRQEIYPILTYLTEQNIKIAHIEGTGSVGQVHDRIEAEVASVIGEKA